MKWETKGTDEVKYKGGNINVGEGVIGVGTQCDSKGQVRVSQN